MNILKFATFFIIISTTIWQAESFMPASLLSSIISRLNPVYYYQFDQYSKTVTHDEIMKRAVIRSIATFFYDQQNGSSLIDLAYAQNDSYTVQSLYNAYFNQTFCDTGATNLITKVFQINVALPDLDKKTKDMPYAHFDAETFVQSNRRVINFTNYINYYLDQGDYLKAQALTGQILHTIQDFYSHSNWIEAGNTDINYAIGTEDFGNLTVVGQNESDCISNCTLQTAECNSFVQIFSSVVNSFGYTSSFISCPIKFYECHGNINLLSKLVSGFYTNQKLDDGTSVPKPPGLGKCSHGGILDATSNDDAIGGINKDSGYYLLSPHADLHLKAVSLATKHSELFLNNIRKRIGDEMYAEFLDIPFNNTVTCSSYIVKPSQLQFSVFTIFASFIIFY